MTTEKAAFDSTICFTFFGSWLRTIVKLETENDRTSLAYMLFKSIAEYALYGEEPTIDPEDRNMVVIDAIWPTLEVEIDSSKNRRKRGFAPERFDEIKKAIINETAENPRLSIREIAAIVGTSKSNVERTQKKYAAEIAALHSSSRDSSDVGVSNVCEDSSVYTVEDYDDCSDYDSRGQGQMGQRSLTSLDEEADYCVDEGDMPF